MKLKLDLRAHFMPLDQETDWTYSTDPRAYTRYKQDLLATTNIQTEHKINVQSKVHCEGT